MSKGAIRATPSPAEVKKNETTEVEEARARVTYGLALLGAIEEGELLAVSPEEAPARDRHRMGVALLDLLREQLETAAEIMDRTRPLMAAEEEET